MEVDREILLKKNAIGSHIPILLSNNYHPSLYNLINGIIKWVDGDGASNVILKGGRGVGKSILGEVAIKVMLEKNVSARRIDWGKFLSSDFDNYGCGKFSKYVYDKLLFIDNFKRSDSRNYRSGMSFIKTKIEEGVKIIIAVTDSDFNLIKNDPYDTIDNSFLIINIGDKNLTNEMLEAEYKKFFKD